MKLEMECCEGMAMTAVTDTAKQKVMRPGDGGRGTKMAKSRTFAILARDGGGFTEQGIQREPCKVGITDRRAFGRRVRGQLEAGAIGMMVEDRAAVPQDQVVLRQDWVEERRREGGGRASPGCR